MDEYIKKSEAVDIIVKYPYNVSGKTATAIKMIEDLPSADVVEVVRCKDCKRFMEYNEDYVREVEKADGDCYIRKMYSCDPQFCAVKSDDFCSYGERRE